MDCSNAINSGLSDVIHLVKCQEIDGGCQYPFFYALVLPNLTLFIARE